MGVNSAKVMHLAYFYAITSGLLASSYKVRDGMNSRDVIIFITNSTILNFLSQPSPLVYQQQPVKTTVNSLLDLPYDILAEPVASVTMTTKPVGPISTTPNTPIKTPSAPIATSSTPIPALTAPTTSSEDILPTTIRDLYQENLEKPQVSEKCQPEKSKKSLNDRNQSCRAYLECKEGKWIQRMCPQAMGFSEKFMDCLWEGVVEGCSTKPTDETAMRNGLRNQVHRNRYE